MRLIIMCLLIPFSIWGQYKTDIPLTHKETCFLAIDRTAFQGYLQVQYALQRGNYRPARHYLNQMQRALKQFKINEHEHSFRIWYQTHYRDYKEQVETTRRNTLASLKNYERSLRRNEAQFFEHRQFLKELLAYLTEYFYPNFWFMTMQRYFSQNFVEQFTAKNAQAEKLFQYSSFFVPFSYFDRLLEEEKHYLQQHLQIGPYGNDPKGIGGQPLIKYSYAQLPPATAGYILSTFDIDDTTPDLDYNREMSELRRMLRRCKERKIWLIVRFNNRPYYSSPSDER